MPRHIPDMLPQEATVGVCLHLEHAESILLLGLSRGSGQCPQVYLAESTLSLVDSSGFGGRFTRRAPWAGNQHGAGTSSQGPL